MGTLLFSVGTLNPNGRVSAAAFLPQPYIADNEHLLCGL